MTCPEVTAVCLYADRPQFRRRFLDCFAAQTYPNKWLLVLDTSLECQAPEECPAKTIWVHAPHLRGQTIGALRNAANAMAVSPILMHWDSDDHSASSRMEQQVSELTSDTDAVGYRTMLFWRDPEAWVYRNGDLTYCIGTSLCYWRKVWERRPFPNRSIGEDLSWCQGLRTRAIRPGIARMIAHVHGGNTTGAVIVPQSANWRRAPEWDSYCAKRMPCDRLIAQ